MTKRQNVFQIDARAFAPAAVAASLSADNVATRTVLGATRQENQDRYDVQLPAGQVADGGIVAQIGVYDGHGGSAVAEYLGKNFLKGVASKWVKPAGAKTAITTLCLETDDQMLEGGDGGFLSFFMERGVGGSKCGSTLAVATLFAEGGEAKLASTNVGDSRVLLVRGGKAVQLSEDHVPDNEDERKRIEYYNPNPKMPLVRFVGECWRVGGILALSRAIGDSYMKQAPEFEGISYGGAEYASGFGVIAEPTIEIATLTDEDEWLVVTSDGLFANEERGGGGGVDNDAVAALASKASSPAELADALVAAAQQAGSTDDITVVCAKLN
eukprot:PRCOL_00002365-RA